MRGPGGEERRLEGESKELKGSHRRRRSVNERPRAVTAALAPEQAIALHPGMCSQAPPRGVPAHVVTAFALYPENSTVLSVALITA